MPDLTVPALAALNPREYAHAIKERLRDDEAWAILLDPILVDRTRWSLKSIITSIDFQKKRSEESGRTDTSWLTKIDTLRFLASGRLERMAPEPQNASGRKEAQAWRSFAAKLAQALEDGDSGALDTLRTPYGNMTASEWLAARDEKAGASS